MGFPAATGGAQGAAPDGILTVRQVTAHIKRLLERDELLQDVIVRGEVSNFTRASSGHLYFSLKDEESQLQAVCFRGTAAGLKFDPKDGDRVVAGGSITVYERGGRYQLIVRFMRPDGVGDLAAALELLRARLEAEGLFDPARKRPLPRFPQVIVLCTSPTGAVVQDMVTIIGRRFPLARMVVVPTVVQGEEAPGSIVRALQIANSLPQADVIILGRGGGSIEDLWAFNDERVARAIFASARPVVSAVGHETDFTIADFVADARAATPSMAAEMVVPDRQELLATLDSMARHLRSAILVCLGRVRRRLEQASASPYLQRPQALLEQRQMRLDEAASGLVRAMRRRLERAGAQAQQAFVALEALSPLAVMRRGYAICRRADGALVRRLADVSVGQDIAVTVADGDVLGTVTGLRPAPNAAGNTGDG